MIGQDIEFNATTYPAGARVVSDLDLHYARLGWIRQPWLIPGRLRLGPVLEAKAFVAEMTLKAPNLVPRLEYQHRDRSDFSIDPPERVGYLLRRGKSGL